MSCGFIRRKLIARRARLMRREVENDPTIPADEREKVIFKKREAVREVEGYEIGCALDPQLDRWRPPTVVKPSE